MPWKGAANRTEWLNVDFVVSGLPYPNISLCYELTRKSSCLIGKRAEQDISAPVQETAQSDANIEHFQQSPGSEPPFLITGVVQAPRRGFGVAEPGTFSGGLCK
jgi:hypothetical protein